MKQIIWTLAISLFTITVEAVIVSYCAPSPVITGVVLGLLFLSTLICSYIPIILDYSERSEEHVESYCYGKSSVKSDCQAGDDTSHLYIPTYTVFLPPW